MANRTIIDPAIDPLREAYQTQFGGIMERMSPKPPEFYPEYKRLVQGRFPSADKMASTLKQCGYQVQVLITPPKDTQYVQVLSAPEGEVWYKDQIGEVFPVINFHGGEFFVDVPAEKKLPAGAGGYYVLPFTHALPVASLSKEAEEEAPKLSDRVSPA